MADFQNFLSSFDSSNLKGKQFEKFCKWFLENDTYWKSKFTKVYLWDDYPKRWGADLGIDLIAEADDGSLCAIQAKCYSPEYPVTKKDMDSFLSESNRKEISTRLLLASTDIIGGNARKVCQSQEKPVTFFLYSDFLNSTIEFPEDINKLTKPKSKSKPKPRPHQADAIKNVLKGFKKHDRGQLIMACGTGKTFTTLWIKEKLNAETTLILLPSLNLLSQTLKEWYFGASKPFKSFAVCSDDSVTKSTEEDAIKESTQDLSFPVSADPKQIQNFLKQKGTKVLFSTYQSSPMIAEAMKSKSVPLFDLVICDEAHRCTGKVGSTFTTVLDDKKIRTKLKLFTTATPRTYSQSVKTTAKLKEIEITGMDDEKVFGTVFHSLNFGQAIANKPPLLTDYQVVVVGVDSPMIKELIDERTLLQINPDDNIDAESLASQIGLLKAVKDYGLKRVISFHGRVNRARNFSKDLIEIRPLISKKHLPKGVIKTDYVSGEMPTNKRYQFLQQLKELDGCDYYILSNARCLSEGVDVPSIDGIAIIDPKKSKTDIVQTIGRAIRLSENKTKGTIVIPVFIEDGDNAEENINNSNFKPVYDVLNALRAHDEELGFELDEMRMELGRKRASTGPSKKIPKVFIDIPTKYSIDFSNSIQTYLVEQSTASWSFWYGLLLDYLEEFDINELTESYKTPKGYHLGKWCTHQRNNLKNKILSKERKKLLDDVNFIWNPSDDNWNKAYEELIEFKKKYTDCNVEQHYKSPSGFLLGLWVSNQRDYIDSKNPQRIKRNKLLNKIGFIWDLVEYHWQEGFDLFVKFIKEQGHARVHQSHKVKNYRPGKDYALGAWCHRNRLNKSELSPKKIKLLNDNGFIWNAEKYKRDLWINDALSQLKKIIAKEGSLLVFVKDYPIINTIRSANGRDTLREEDKEKISSLGFVWNANEARLDTTWMTYFEMLKDFYKQNKHFEIKRRDKINGKPFGLWVGKQRQAIKNKTIKSSYKAKLDSIGFK